MCWNCKWKFLLSKFSKRKLFKKKRKGLSKIQQATSHSNSTQDVTYMITLIFFSGRNKGIKKFTKNREEHLNGMLKSITRRNFLTLQIFWGKVFHFKWRVEAIRKTIVLYSFSHHKIVLMYAANLQCTSDCRIIGWDQLLTKSC